MDVITILREHTPILKRQFGVESIGAFGSFVRGEEGPDSDVVAHGYFHIAYEMIWEIIFSTVPEFKSSIITIRDDEI